MSLYVCAVLNRLRSAGRTDRISHGGADFFWGLFAFCFFMFIRTSSPTLGVSLSDPWLWMRWVTCCMLYQAPPMSRTTGAFAVHPLHRLLFAKSCRKSVLRDLTYIHQSLCVLCPRQSSLRRWCASAGRWSPKSTNWRGEFLCPVWRSEFVLPDAMDSFGWKRLSKKLRCDHHRSLQCDGCMHPLWRRAERHKQSGSCLYMVSTKRCRTAYAWSEKGVHIIYRLKLEPHGWTFTTNFAFACVFGHRAFKLRSLSRRNQSDALSKHLFEYWNCAPATNTKLKQNYFSCNI